MGECKQRDWQKGASSVRERMDHLYNNPDMSDLTITAVDQSWSWGQTSQEFIGHKLVLCSASPVFHQLFFPKENGVDIPKCFSLTKSGGGGVCKLEIQDVPPIAVEGLLEYCYKDRFDKTDYENGYSRNLLWRLWEVAKLLQMNHLFDLCCEALDKTMCEETVYWDYNYSLQYHSFGTEHIKAKVSDLCKSLNNNLFTHSNFVFLDQKSIRELVGARLGSSSEPIVIYNNLLRWAIFQLDRTLLEEFEGSKGSDIPVTERSKLITKIREEKVKDYTFSDLSKYLDIVLDLVPWKEMSQKDFMSFVAHTNILPESMLLSASLIIMEEALKNPDRLTKSSYLLENDPNTVKTELSKAMENVRSRGPKGSGPDESPVGVSSRQVKSRESSQVREKADIKAKLEEARQRRLMIENSRLSKNLEDAAPTQNLLLVE